MYIIEGSHAKILLNHFDVASSYRSASMTIVIRSIVDVFLGPSWTNVSPVSWISETTAERDCDKFYNRVD